MIGLVSKYQTLGLHIGIQDKEIRKGDEGMKILITLLLLLIIFPSSAGCAITHKYGPYYGKVVEAETKEPIEEAAVLVVFYTEEYGPAGAITRYADALETVTDKNGEFRIPAHRVTTFRPLQGWDLYGYFTIFKPGYGYYPIHKDVKPKFVPGGTLPTNQYVMIELPRLKTKEERLNMPSVNFDIPYEKQKRFIELINQELERLRATGKYSKESFGRR